MHYDVTCHRDKTDDTNYFLTLEVVAATAGTKRLLVVAKYGLGKCTITILDVDVFVRSKLNPRGHHLLLQNIPAWYYYYSLH